MNSSSDLLESLERVYSCRSDEVLVIPFDFERKSENELLFLIKPGAFKLDKIFGFHELITVISSRFQEFNVYVDGGICLTGNSLKERRIMEKHYQGINELSNKASQIIGKIELSQMEKLLGRELCGVPVLGGHEFLQLGHGFDERTLNNLWMTKKSFKLRSGFYFQSFQILGHQVVIVNGFHPLQLASYTQSACKIIALMLHSDNDWKILRQDMIGDTYPEKARSSSIRRILWDRAIQLGINEISVANNIVHLSAGPYEALFELDNFLIGSSTLHFSLDDCTITRLMRKAGMSLENVIRALSNPTVNFELEKGDLFSLTENMNSTEAIALYYQFLQNSIH